MPEERTLDCPERGLKTVAPITSKSRMQLQTLADFATQEYFTPVLHVIVSLGMLALTHSSTLIYAFLAVMISA